MDYKTLFQEWKQLAVVNRKLRKHDLLPKALRKQLPPIGHTAEQDMPEIIAYAKFFHPFSHWYWYVYEFDHEDGDTLFCYVLGDYVEHGSVSLLELESLQVRGLPVERDLFFKPCSLNSIKAQHRKNEPTHLRSW